jgi:hypothetical protein
MTSKAKKQLEHWESRAALLAHRTKLYCTQHGVQAVVDYRPLTKEACLGCGCLRKVETEVG